MRSQRRNRRSRTLSHAPLVFTESLESRRLLTHYYVDADSGDDSNPGTVEEPFKSYLPFVEAWGQTDQNIGKIDLQAGDIVQFAPGVYTATFNNPNANDQGFALRNVHGTEEFPVVLRGGPEVVFDARPADESEFSTMWLFQSSHVVVEGIEFTGRGRGLALTETEYITARDLWFHDIDGWANGNIAGMEIHSSKNVQVYNSLFSNNYDHTQNHQNSRQIVLFQNDGHIHIHHNVFQNDDPAGGSIGGAGVDVKHGADGSYEFNHNIVVNASSSSIGTSTTRSEIHHNLVIDSAPFNVRDFGGAAYFNDIEFSNNTQTAVVGNTGGGFSINMHECWYGNPDHSGEDCNPNHQRPIESYDSLGPVDFNDNIVVDHRQNNQDRGVVRISTYGTDARYETVIEQHALRTDGNVYFNTADEALFNVFNVNGGDRGVKGAAHNFAGWQDLGFDVNGAVADPQFDDVYMPQNTVAAGAGWYADEAPRLTILVADDELISEGGATQAVVVRSGDGLNLNQRLTVSLAATDASEVSFPQTVTFEPGEHRTYFTISGTNDGEDDGTRATRIYADADGFTNNVSAWVRVEDDGQGGGADPGFSVIQTGGGTTVGENGSTDTFSVRLNAAPASNVMLNVVSSDVGEATVAPATLTFTPANWNTVQTVTVTGVDDDIVDGAQTSTITVSVDAASNAAWRDLPAQAVTVATTDNDTRQNTPGWQDGLLVLPGEATDIVTLEFDWAQRLGQYDNELGFFLADDLDGRVDGVLPTGTGYAQVALTDESRRVVFASGQTQGAHTTNTVPGGSYVVFYMVQNASTSKLLMDNAGNNLNARPIVFFSLPEANPDDFDHVRVTVPNTNTWRFGWEDIEGGGDESFTDAVIDLSVSVENGGGTNDVYQQHVSSDTREKTVAEGGIVEIPVLYTTFGPNGQAAALGSNLISFNLHFDEDALEFLGATDVLEEGLLVIPTTVRPETHPVVVGPDNDAATDSVLTASFSDNDGVTNPGWPNAPDANGTVLYLVRFRAKAGLEQTAIHFTSNATGTVTGERAEYEFATESVTVSVADLSGDVNGDLEFDANDSFLVHLVMLGGSNEQVSQNLGASPLSATEVRTKVQTLAASVDVDGDGDFDANDSFLMHLVKLSGSDVQIDLNKGVSPLSAEQIRNNVDALGGSGKAGPIGQARAALDRNVLSSRQKKSTVGPAVTDNVAIPQKDDAAEPYELFHNNAALNLPVQAAIDKTPVESTINVFENFREWVDVL